MTVKPHTACHASRDSHSQLNLTPFVTLTMTVSESHLIPLVTQAMTVSKSAASQTACHANYDSHNDSRTSQRLSLHP